jgi:predicted aldo/keto reductase-like oxidoreductase
MGPALPLADAELEGSHRKRELHESLRRLGIEKFDLYQMHALGSMEEIDQALGPDGAIEALEEVSDTGLMDYLGITGHEDMRVLHEAIIRYDFDTLLLPVTLSSAVAFHPQNDYRPVLEEAEDRGMSVTAIKAICKGRWRDEVERSYRTWYKPYDIQGEVDLGVAFTLSQPGVVTYLLACDHRLWNLILAAGEVFEAMDEVEQREAISYAEEKGYSPIFPI